MPKRNCLIWFVVAVVLTWSAQTGAFAKGRQKRSSTPQELSARLGAYLKQAAAFGFSGSVLVGMDGKIIVQQGYGVADRNRGMAVTPQSVFDIGSITKQFTAAAIMKLEMQGKVQTEDLISKYLDGVPPDKAGVTIHHLLTHTAGFPEYSGGDYEVSERDETVKRILQTPLTSEPGKEMNYSNAGYSVLAAIVEKVSGQSYESFLQEYLFKPAGMTQTGYVMPRFDRATLSHGYNGKKDEGTPRDHLWSPTGPYWNLLGNGGILSNAGDMYLWCKALQGDAILSADAKKKMFTPFLNNYAYGWDVVSTEHGLVIGHNGGSDFGFNAHIHWYPEKNIVIITMSNSGEYFRDIYADVVARKLDRMIFGEEILSQKTPAFIKLDSSALKTYEGAYRLPSGEKFVVTLRDEQLTIEPAGQAAVNVLALSSPAYEEASARTQMIVTGIVKKDFQALRESLPGEEALNRYRAIFEQRMSTWEKSDGSFKDFQVLGTVPSWWSDNPGPATFVRLNFEKRSHFFRFHWTEGKIRGLGGEAIQSPITIPLQPTAANSFFGWHLSFAKPISVRFRTVSNHGMSLTITADGKDFKADKL